MVLFEAMGIQLTIKKIYDKNMDSLHKTVHNVLKDEEMRGNRVKL